MRDFVCSYVPPHIIDHIAGATDSEQAAAARQTALMGKALRDQRSRLVADPKATLATLQPPRAGKADRAIYDDKNGWTVSNNLVRGEDDPATGATNVDAAYDGLGATREFYKKVLGRNSIDNNGLAMQAHVNFGVDFDNAFWDGSELVFGNGDNVIFTDFTGDVDVIGHELSHGVTQYTANLEYHDQPGALNEATSDIFGVCVEQYAKNLDAGSFNWLIGEDIMAPGLYGEALRSMAHPGTAYDNPVLGKDPQVAHMSDYVPGGDVHINSGIINRAFYLMATDLGSLPAAKLWYATLQNLWPTADFAAAAAVCAQNARVLAKNQVIARQGPQTVRWAFREVGVI